MSKIISNNKRGQSSDFIDIEEREGEGDEVATPVKLSSSKIDVESLLKKSHEVRDRIRKKREDDKIKDSPKQLNTFSSDYKYKEENKRVSPDQNNFTTEDVIYKNNKNLKKQIIVEINPSKDEKPLQNLEVVKSRTYNYTDQNNPTTHEYLHSGEPRQYLARSHALDTFQVQPQKLQNSKKLQKQVAISMSETPQNFNRNFKNLKQKRNHLSPNFIGNGRISTLASPHTAFSHRSSTTIKSYNFRIGHSNKNNKFNAASPKNSYFKRKSRVSEKSSNKNKEQGYVAALQKELQNEQFHMQTIGKLMKEIEDLHIMYKAREDKINKERAQEKEIYKKALADSEQKLKHHEATIHMLEVMATETENTGKTKTEHFETTIQDVVKQLQDQQKEAHTLKNENNSLKIQINQLTVTVEGQ